MEIELLSGYWVNVVMGLLDKFKYKDTAKNWFTNSGGRVEQSWQS